MVVVVVVDDDPENKFPTKGGSGRCIRNALASGIQFAPALVASFSSFIVFFTIGERGGLSAALVVMFFSLPFSAPGALLKCPMN